jgi:transcriptional regulator with XRE-family HTH domain
MTAKPFDEIANETMSRADRAKAIARSKEIVAGLLVSHVRKLAGRSQLELANKLGIKQPAIAKIEGQSDMQISTLKKIVEALGGEMHITARFPRKLLDPAPTKKSKKRRPARAGTTELQLI